MRRDLQKRKAYRNQKVLDACHDQGEICLVQLPGCRTMPTMPAHSNQADDGKGTSIKADDCFVAMACQNCHDIIDGRTPPPWEAVNVGTPKTEIEWYHDRGIKRTIRRLIDKEVLK